jgi:uncharacterized RDD family membrane protein YckC
MNADWGHFWNRFMAYVTDSWVMIIAYSVGAALGRIAGGWVLADEAGLEMAGFAGSAFWTLSAWMVNSVLLPGLTGTSCGKWLFGLQLARRSGGPIGPGRAALRSVFFPLSCAPLYLGCLWALFHRDGATWHDMICDTAVIKKGARHPAKRVEESAPTSRAA